MNYNKPFILLKNLPKKLNDFYKKNSKYPFKIQNKSKNKKIYDPVTNLDKAFERFIRQIIIKHFPEDAILGEEFLEKYSYKTIAKIIDDGIQSGYFELLSPDGTKSRDNKIKNIRPSEELVTDFLNLGIEIISYIGKNKQ